MNLIKHNGGISETILSRVAVPRLLQKQPSKNRASHFHGTRLKHQ